MNRFKLIIYIVLLAVAALGIYIFVSFSDSMFETDSKLSEKKEITEIKKELSEYDYKIYWVGDVPSTLSDMKITKLESFEEKDLPLNFATVTNTRETYDDFGNATKVIDKQYISQDCPKYPFIIITDDSNITDEDRERFRKCIEETDTRVIVLGREAASNYREYLFLRTGYTVDCSSLFLSSSDITRSEIFRKENASNPGSVEFEKELLLFMKKEIVGEDKH